jgi:hypothetical protein
MNISHLQAFDEGGLVVEIDGMIFLTEAMRPNIFPKGLTPRGVLNDHDPCVDGTRGGCGEILRDNQIRKLVRGRGGGRGSLFIVRKEEMEAIGENVFDTNSRVENQSIRIDPNKKFPISDDWLWLWLWLRWNRKVEVMEKIADEKSLIPSTMLPW